MNASTHNNRTTIRNLFIFVIVFNLLAWLGWLIAQAGSVETIGLGTLIWLGAPLLVSILIRLFSRDWKDLGIKPKFMGNGKWYAFSFLVFPAIVTLVLLVGLIFGGVNLAEFQAGPFFGSLVASFFSFTFVKNFSVPLDMRTRQPHYHM